MWDWLEKSWHKTWSVAGDEHPEVILFRLGVAAALGFGMAAVRTFARSEGRPAPGLRTTLLLLTMLTALVTEVVGDNTARAFGLAGVLAVVRFRTVVEDTRDSAFVIFAMAIGMAVGAGYLYTSLVGFGCIALVAIVVTQLTGPATYDAKLQVRVRGKETSEADVRAILAPLSNTVLLTGVETGKEGDLAEFSFRFQPFHTAKLAPLVDQLRAKTGVEKVNWEIR